MTKQAPRGDAGYMALSRLFWRSAILLFLILPACGGSSSDLASSTTGAEAVVFTPQDLDGVWVGVSEPLEPNVQRLELTLGFESFGPTANAIGLTHYSFPGINQPGVVDYLALLDTYDLSFGPSGRLSLDTTLFLTLPNGQFLEERVMKDLWMADDGETLIGTEVIEDYINGSLDQRISNLLTMKRVL